MKLRYVLALVVLVLAAALVGPALAEEAGAPALPGVNEVTTPAVTPAETPDCNAESGAEESGEVNLLDVLGPQPTSQAIPCGQCSQDPCKGATRGALCGFSGGQFKYCIPQATNLCPGTQTWDCQCTSGGYF